MTNLDPEPIDRTHAECLIARDAIRRRVNDLRQQIAVWEPRKQPTKQQIVQGGLEK